MSLNISFESEEEILGIVVNKPDETVTVLVSDGLSPVTGLVECHNIINQSIVILTKYIDDHKYISDILKILSENGFINKTMVNNINNVFPDLLGSKVNINDFTDASSKTNIQVVINFLIEKLNQIKDNILVSYTEGVYKNLESFINKINSICLSSLEEKLSNHKLQAQLNLKELTENGKVAIFKDGVLYKAVDCLLDPTFIDLLKIAPIANLNINELINKISIIKKVLDIHDNICPNTLLNKDSSYSELMSYLANLDIHETIEHLDTFKTIIADILNEKKLLGSEGNIRDTLVSKVLDSQYLNDLDNYVCRYIRILILFNLYEQTDLLAIDLNLK